MLLRWYFSEVWVIVALVAMIISGCLLTIFETARTKKNIVFRWIVIIIFFIAFVAVMARSIQQFIVFSWLYF